jgi:hypothetical protein
MIEKLNVSISSEVVEKVPDLFVKTKVVRNICVGKPSQELQEGMRREI